MNIPHRIIVGCCVILVSILVGCSSKESRVIGKWTAKEPTVYLAVNIRNFEFFSDKTFIIEEYPDYNCSWTILNDGRIKMDFHGDTVVIGELKKGVLTFNLPYMPQVNLVRNN